MDEPPRTALILAGGFGSRLRGVVSDRPKALAPILGRPFLQWQMDALARQGVRTMIICTHYMAEMIEAAFPAGRRPDGTAVVHCREVEPLGTGGALRLGAGLADADTAPMLGVNGDTFCAFDLAAMAAAHAAGTGRMATLLLAEVSQTGRYGRVEADAAGQVTAFHEKDPAETAPGWINAGVYLLDRQALTALPPDRPLSLEREVFPSWIGRGLGAFAGGRDFLDIGTPESYAMAEDYLRSRA